MSRKEELLEKITDLGYNAELADYFIKMFSTDECTQFVEACENQRPLTIRLNPSRVGSFYICLFRLISVL